MTSKNKSTITVLFAGLLMMGSIAMVLPYQEASAATIRDCDTSNGPKGVDSITSFEVWVATSSGDIHEFTSSSGCTKSTDSGAGDDPHFIEKLTSTKVAFTEHTNDKITYLNPSTGATSSCTDADIDGPDDIESYTSSYQFITSYNNGKVIKTERDGSGNCSIDAKYNVPGTGANPEGIDRSTDITGMFVIDQANKKLYKMTQTGTFTLCQTFAQTPWYVAVDDSNDLLYMTFNSEKKIRAIPTLNCGVVAETSTAHSNRPHDIAVWDSIEVVVVMNDVSKVAHYDFGTDSWTTHDWSGDCSSCTGFGIDVSSSRYFATMDGTSDHKLVVGDF